MKRDMELVRKILLRLENDDGAKSSALVPFEIDGYQKDTVSYHVDILGHGGLLRATRVEQFGNSYYVPTQLTWEGHDFLDSIRDETVWNKVKQEAAARGGDLPFEVLKALAVGLLKGTLGL